MERKNRPQFDEIDDEKPVSNKKLKIPSIGGGMFPILVSVGLIILLYVYSGNIFVSKTDNTKNITDVLKAVDANASDIRAISDSVNSAVRDIPATITNQVNSSFNTYSSRLATMEASIKALENLNITGSLAGVSVLTKDISDIKASIVALQTQLGEKGTTSVSVALANASTKITALEAQVKALQTSVTALQTSTAISTITIGTAPIIYAVTTAVAINMPLFLTNTGTGVTVPVKLVLTTAGTITAITPTMDRLSTASVSGTTITFFLNLDVGANSTVTFNQNITLVYTGTSPNSWTATWSKQ